MRKILFLFFLLLTACDQSIAPTAIKAVKKDVPMDLLSNINTQQAFT